MESDRLIALAWQAEEDSKCPGCAQPFSESTDVEAEEDYDTSAIVCHACADRERYRRRHTELPEGTFLMVDKRPDLQ